MFTKKEFNEKVWYDIPEYEGLYKINHDGDILSLNYENRGYAQVLRQYLNNKGYKFVRLVKNREVKGKTIHRLLAQTFIYNSDPTTYTDVNHIDENPLNNSLDNLEWVAHKDNLNHGTARLRTALGHQKSVAQLDMNDKIINVYSSITEAAKAVNAHISSISAVAKGKAKTAGGYRWAYTNEPPKTVRKLYELDRCIGDF